jgi:cellulose synthase/poly-beta-1,6-N-acetylglucosamine synthase-like glycosyltransferase
MNNLSNHTALNIFIGILSVASFSTIIAQLFGKICLPWWSIILLSPLALPTLIVIICCTVGLILAGLQTFRK